MKKYEAIADRMVDKSITRITGLLDELSVEGEQLMKDGKPIESTVRTIGYFSGMLSNAGADTGEINTMLKRFIQKLMNRLASRGISVSGGPEDCQNPILWLQISDKNPQLKISAQASGSPMKLIAIAKTKPLYTAEPANRDW